MRTLLLSLLFLFPAFRAGHRRGIRQHVAASEHGPTLYRHAFVEKKIWHYYKSVGWITCVLRLSRVDYQDISLIVTYNNNNSSNELKNNYMLRTRMWEE